MFSFDSNSLDISYVETVKNIYTNDCQADFLFTSYNEDEATSALGYSELCGRKYVSEFGRGISIADQRYIFTLIVNRGYKDLAVLYFKNLIEVVDKNNINNIVFSACISSIDINLFRDAYSKKFNDFLGLEKECDQYRVRRELD
jgi:hypothetical protein